MRTYGNFSVSLPPDMREAAEKRAKSLGYKRSTYIQQLILSDLKKHGVEPTEGSSSIETPNKRVKKKKAQ